MTEVRPLLIVGSGPAGLTAAVYASRANLHPVVIEGIAAGGQLMLTSEVENYPGFPDGILGPELMTKFREQAARFGAEFVTADADRVDLFASPFGAWVSNTEYRGQAIIISTGATARMLGLESEQRLLGHGVSTCATCDGFFFRDKPLVVVGGGDSAVEEATFLTKFATQVTVIHRRDQLRATKIMADRAYANPKIDFRWNSVVEEVVGNGQVEAVRLRDTVTDERSELPGERGLRRDRPRPQHRAVPRPARLRRGRLHRDRPRLDDDLGRRGLRRGGRPGPRLPPGSDRGGQRLHGRDGGGALARGPGRQRLPVGRRHAAECQPGRSTFSLLDSAAIAVSNWTKGVGVSEHILKLTDSTFDETISGAEKPVLVDFWAEWCGPCKMIAPVLEELATENKERLQVAKLNVDDNPNVAMRYNVMSIPTLLVFKPGESAQEARRLVGAKSKAALLQELAEFVA